MAEVLGPRRLPHYGSPAAGAAAGKMGSMIGRMHHVVVDCPDPAAVAGFYSALLGLPVIYRDDDWLVVAASDISSGLAFQRAPGNLPRTWPDAVQCSSSFTWTSWWKMPEPRERGC